MLAIAVKITSKEALYQRYFSLGEYGGVFVKTNEEMEIDTEVLVNLTLKIEGEEENTFEKIPGKINWVNYKETKNRPKGIGIRFVGKEAEAANKRMLVLLGELVHSQKPSFML